MKPNSNSYSTGLQTQLMRWISPFEATVGFAISSWQIDKHIGLLSNKLYDGFPVMHIYSVIWKFSQAFVTLFTAINQGSKSSFPRNGKRAVIGQLRWTEVAAHLSRRSWGRNRCMTSSEHLRRRLSGLPILLSHPWGWGDKWGSKRHTIGGRLAGTPAGLCPPMTPICVSSSVLTNGVGTLTKYMFYTNDALSFNNACIPRTFASCTVWDVLTLVCVHCMHP